MPSRKGGLDAAEDGGRRLARKLLIDDRPQQGLERALHLFGTQRERPRALHQPRQQFVGAGQSGRGGERVEGKIHVVIGGWGLVVGMEAGVQRSPSPQPSPRGRGGNRGAFAWRPMPDGRSPPTVLYPTNARRRP